MGGVRGEGSECCDGDIVRGDAEREEGGTECEDFVQGAKMKFCHGMADCKLLEL